MYDPKLAISYGRMVITFPQRKTRFSDFNKNGHLKHTSGNRKESEAKEYQKIPNNYGDEESHAKHPDNEAHMSFENGKYYITSGGKFKANNGELYMNALIDNTSQSSFKKTKRVSIPMFDCDIYKLYTLCDLDSEVEVSQESWNYEKNYNPFNYKFKL